MCHGGGRDSPVLCQQGTVQAPSPLVAWKLPVPSSRQTLFVHLCDFLVLSGSGCLGRGQWEPVLGASFLGVWDSGVEILRPSPLSWCLWQTRI